MNYSYTISTDTSNAKLYSKKLEDDILASSIAPTLDKINTDGDTMTIWFMSTLSSEEETMLDGLVAAHDGEPYPLTETAQLVRLNEEDPDTGGVLVTNKFAPDGWYQKIHEFEFCTAKLDCVEDEKQDLTDYNYAIIKFYDSNDVELTTQADITSNCVITVLDWTPTHDIGLLSGYCKQIVKPNTRCKIWGIGSPHVPAVMGGTQVFVDGTNLEFEDPGNSVGVRGVSTTIVPYQEIVPSSGLYANTIRFKIWTPDSPGFVHRIQVKLEMFVPGGT